MVPYTATGEGAVYVTVKALLVFVKGIALANQYFGMHRSLL